MFFRFSIVFCFVFRSFYRKTKKTIVFQKNENVNIPTYCNIISIKRDVQSRIYVYCSTACSRCLKVDPVLEMNRSLHWLDRKSLQTEEKMCDITTRLQLWGEMMRLHKKYFKLVLLWTKTYNILILCTIYFSLTWQSSRFGLGF